ncbi:MAG: ATP-binding protein, partial [Dehalococcoidales bacterium]|nr:ATP-binding protein [Dehalococcoidales bacterium]
PTLFVVVPEFLDHLRSTFNPESKISYDQLFERVKTRTLLVLDDFGEQTTTPWVREKLYQVISHRYNAKLPTVFTTRCSLEEILEDMDSAISSRLVDHQFSTPFNITAPDYRGDISSARGTKKSGRGRRRR